MAKAAGSKIETAFDFSKSLQKLQPDSFFRFLREYPHPDGTAVYVYRLEPQIDRKLAGLKDSNIDVTNNEVDEEYLLRQHGSGKYHLKFTDANKPKGLTEVAKCTVDVQDPHVAPVVNPVELVVSAPGNQRLVQQYLEKGWTVEDGRLRAPARSESGNEVLARTVSDLAGQVANKPTQSEASSDLVRRALDVLSAPKGNGLEDTIRVAELLHPRTDPTMVELIKVLVAERGRPAAEQARPDAITQLKDTAGLLKELGWGQGGGGSWVDAITALPGILQYGSQMLQQMVMMRTLQSRVVPIDRPGARQTVSLPVEPVEPAAEPAAEEVIDPGVEMFGNSLGINVKALIDVGQDAIDAFERGMDGDDFAHGLCCRRGGEQLYAKLSGLGKDGILSVIQLVPGLKEKLAPKRAEIETWLEAFLRYGVAEPGTEAAA